MKATKQAAEGTSFHGVTIKTRPIDLISLANKLGAEYYDSNDGNDKCNFDFEFETSKGDVFTIYDWKQYRVLEEDEKVIFNIGAADRSISQTAKREILAILNFCPVEALQGTDYGCEYGDINGYPNL